MVGVGETAEVLADFFRDNGYVAFFDAKARRPAIFGEDFSFLTRDAPEWLIHHSRVFVKRPRGSEVTVMVLKDRVVVGDAYPTKSEAALTKELSSLLRAFFARAGGGVVYVVEE